MEKLSMDPPTSDKEQKKVLSKLRDLFKKLGPSPAESAGPSKSPATVEESPLMPEPCPARQSNQINVTTPKSNGQTQNSRTPDSTWDRASELLRRRRPDLYADLEDLKGFQDSSVWLQSMLAECKNMRDDDAHRRSFMNVEKVLRSVLVYRDVAVAVSRLDPHGIAPMVLTGVCVVAQAALNGLQHHEAVTAAVDTIAALVAYWTNYERRSLMLQDEALRNEIAKLKESLVDLYATILEIQLCLTRYCNESIFRRVAGAAYRLEVLENQVKSMKGKDENCQRYKSTVDVEVAFQKRNGEILQWISPTDPLSMHEGVLDRTKIKAEYANCGEWLLEKPEFRNWDSEDNNDQVLWLYGTVGTGKTTLMAKVIDWHLSRSSLYSESPFAIYYCSDSSGQRSSDSTTILRSLVRQLCWRAASTTISEPVQEIYERLKRDRPNDGLLSLNECKRILIEIFKHDTGARIFIDALDECDHPQTVLDVLESISTAGQGIVKIFATSRTEVLGLAKHEFPDACFLELDKLSTRADMDIYIQREVRERKPHLRLLQKERLDLEERLIKLLSQRAGGMFRWVELQLSLFLDQKPRFRHPEDVVSNLDRLEKVTVSGRAELDKTYSQILDRNTRENSRDRQYAWAAYSIVLYARRELTFEELAAAVRWHNDSDEDDNSVTVEYVTDICRDCLNKSTSGVAEFAHVSAKEFLLDKKNGDDLEYSPERCHELLAKICFNNLLRVYQRPAFSEEETSPEEGNSLNDESKALKAYTQLYWPEHLGFVDGKISENLSGKLWQFLLKDSAPSSTYVKWADGLISKYSHEFEIMRTLKRDYHDRLSHRLFSAASSPPTPLAALCAFGFVSLIPLLNVFNLFDWNRMQTVDKTEWGTLLFITAEEGHEVVVELLLTKGADINARGGESGTVTALYAASRAGHKKVVELLLTKGADVNAQGGYHGNALQAASSKGHEKVVELLLLAKDAEVNAQGGHFGNALCAASHAGHEKVVELLLAKGAYVNAQGGYYGSALYAASYAGHEKVVERLLLATGVDVNAEGGHFGNVLQAASDRGYKKVVELLLAKGADVNAQGGYHGNALQAASSEGHEKVVELLLAKGADVNAQGGHFNNALEVASYAGHEKVVELLLATGADVNVQGGDVGSALQAASNKGHEKVVELLLAKGADVNVQGGDFPTALQAASYKGYEKVVKLLLDKGANVNAQGGHFNNALEAASYAGHEKVVELLLAKGAVS